MIRRPPRSTLFPYTTLFRSPKARPFHFNAAFDQQAGYRTRSLITLPMRNGKGEVLGVLQLINCKRNAKARLTDSDRKSTRLNSSHLVISYAVFCLKKKKHIP